MKSLLYFISISLISCQVNNENNSNNCDQINNFLYNYFCVSKDCLFEKIYRFQNQTVNIFGNVKQTQQSSLYQINITYNDTNSNQLVSDPINCIYWRLYQTVNNPLTNPIRQHVPPNNYNQKPEWPKAVYQFDKDLNQSIITFQMTQQDLDNQKCYSYTQQSDKYWECYFEFAFIFQNITQVSYYFSIIIHADLSTGTNVDTVDFNNIQQIKQCDTSQCNVQVNVIAKLSFCSDNTCLQIQDSPFSQLILNKPFWMEYQIIDNNFNKFYVINQTLTLQSQNLKITMNSQAKSLFQIIQSKPGYNIAELRVPLTSKDVIVSIKGILTRSNQSGNRFLQNVTNDNHSFVAFATKNFGSVIENDVDQNTQSVNNSTENNIPRQKIVIGVQSFSILPKVQFTIILLLLIL